MINSAETIVLVWVYDPPEFSYINISVKSPLAIKWVLVTISSVIENPAPVVW